MNAAQFIVYVYIVASVKIVPDFVTYWTVYRNILLCCLQIYCVKEVGSRGELQ